MNSGKPGIRCLIFKIYLIYLLQLLICCIICCRFHIYWESWVLFLLLLCSLIICTNIGIHYGSMVLFICLHFTLPHYHHYADISEGVELIKCSSGTFCQLCVFRLNQFSQLFFMQYMGLCVFSLPISAVMIVKIYVLYHIIFLIKSEVWPISHWLMGHTSDLMRKIIW